jgi:hypothetical protein
MKVQTRNQKPETRNQKLFKPLNRQGDKARGDKANLKPETHTKSN